MVLQCTSLPGMTKEIETFMSVAAWSWNVLQYHDVQLNFITVHIYNQIHILGHNLASVLRTHT